MIDDIIRRLGYLALGTVLPAVVADALDWSTRNAVSGQLRRCGPGADPAES